MATSKERTLQELIRSTLSAATSPPVRHWDQNNVERVIPCILVHVQPRERIAPNFDYYRLPVALTIVQDRNDDGGTNGDNIYEDVAAYAISLQAGTLNADGVVMVQGSEEVEDNLHFRAINLEVYLTIPN